MTPAASPDHAAVRAPTALITGAGSGIGRSTAQRLAATGWHCLLLDTDADSMARVIDTLPGRAARHRAIPIDLTDAAQVSALADLDRPIDAVINNAGRTASANQSLIEQATGEMDSLLALNLLAPAAVTGAVDRLLTPGARVVNVASGAGLRAIPYRGLYSATKAGLIEQTLALARARPDLAVSVVCPGFVRTDLVDALIAAGRLDTAQALSKTPLGRMAAPAEIAEGLAFLASPEAAPLSGGVIRLCGGSSVYGGSVACREARAPVWPLDSPTELTHWGDPDERWLAATRPIGRHGYPAIVDAGALLHRPQTTAERLHGIVASARRFAGLHPGPASLTLLLPGVSRDGGGESTATDVATARMLVATLACEMATRALRVNALEVPPDDAQRVSHKQSYRQSPDGPPIDTAGSACAATSAGWIRRLAPIIAWMAGARAQFLTGQTLEVRCP